MIKLFACKNYYIHSPNIFEAIDFSTGKDNITRTLSHFVYNDINGWKIDPDRYNRLKLVLEYK